MLMQRRIERWLLLAGLLVLTPLLPAQTPDAAAHPESSQIPAVSPDDVLRGATEAIDAGHLPEGRASLDRLRALNEKQRGLWAAYAVLSLREKAPETAVTDFQKELGFHPDEFPVYGALSSLLVELKRRPEALAVLQQWEAVAPGDPRPAGSIVTLLLGDARTGEALKAGHDALARLPEAARGDPQLQYALATAELKAGDKAAGAKRLMQLLDTVSDSSARNSIAYELADTGVELSTAEVVERGVVGQVELESEGWSLNAGPQPLQFGTPLLVAMWDTLGWILFREGKPAAAEPFVRASWRNEPRGTVGEHLAEIEEVLGKHTAAVADLQLAVAAAKGEAVQDAAHAAEVTEMESRLAGLSRAPAGGPRPAPELSDAGGKLALERLRTFTLGPSGGRNGSASYRIVVARGKVVAAAPLSPEKVPITAGAALLSHADLDALFPASGSFVQLVHVANLQCTPKNCELVLQP